MKAFKKDGKKKKAPVLRIVSATGVNVDQKLRDAADAIRRGTAHEVLPMFDRTAERMRRIGFLAAMARTVPEHVHLEAIYEEHRRLTSGLIRLLFPIARKRKE